MKKFFFLCLFIPVLGMSQDKNVVNTNRVFAKIDKVLEFEKALAAHSQKYHTGDWKWRVYEISSGPDAGGYMITEGPVSWEQIDARGNLGNEHNVDWNKNVTPFLTDRGSSAYSVFEDTLSTVAIGDYADKINISHYMQKVGHGDKVRKYLRQMVPVWKKGEQSVAVYSSSGSGSAQFSVVTRYKNGLKERANGYRKPMKERYEAINGADSWDKYMDMVKKDLLDLWSELLFYRADLSSK
jgi:hypothetical protein